METEVATTDDAAQLIATPGLQQLLDRFAQEHFLRFEERVANLFEFLTSNTIRSTDESFLGEEDLSAFIAEARGSAVPDEQPHWRLAGTLCPLPGAGFPEGVAAARPSRGTGSGPSLRITTRTFLPPGASSRRTSSWSSAPGAPFRNWRSFGSSATPVPRRRPCRRQQSAPDGAAGMGRMANSHITPWQ